MEWCKFPVNAFEYNYLFKSEELKEFAHVNKINFIEMLIEHVKYEQGA